MSTQAPLRVIVADDEPLARQALRRFLLADGDAAVVAEAEDVPSLVEALRTRPADVLFLDITMPGGSGLDAAPCVPPGMAIVFTTAHAGHAVTAYAMDAVDYLLKPFSGMRFAESLARVRRTLAARLPAAMQTETPRTIQVLLVRVGPRLYPVDASAIWRLTGADDFVQVVTAERSWLHAATLATLGRQLDPALFVRVHRRHVVNLRHVVRVEAHDERRIAAVFADGSRVVCSRAGSAALRLRARDATR